LLDAGKFGTKECAPSEVYTKAMVEYVKGGTLRQRLGVGLFGEVNATPRPDQAGLHLGVPVYGTCPNLGDDPENVFASVDRQAFAAASMGQVQKARLKTGEERAVKIQNPGIA
jgi:hypothetical protein